jgi:UDP-N-acetylglucosamine--N-acetylmuramyl-(pentapeptide) pyrophosphoryl-undecaprenol N-acetylglucosamine transferase
MKGSPAMPSATDAPMHVAIACGGTGGHLYPGLAVAERLWEAGARVTLVVSQKEVDQQALRGDTRFEVLTLPAVGFAIGRFLHFATACWKSYRIARRAFRESKPSALLSMGGFTSVPPAWAVRQAGGRVMLHEANAIPGRANRWLARVARKGFVFFPEAARRLPMPSRDVEVVGMPVRSQFQEVDPGSCRLALGLRPDRRVLLVMGGSQGASGVNDVVLAAVPRLARSVPGLQWLHLTGPADEVKVRNRYREAGVAAVVRPFLTEMELALGAADAAVARAGASSAAELAAVGVPPFFLPFPHAADDHQTANARALEQTGAARWMHQKDAYSEAFAESVIALLTDETLRARIKAGLASWHRADADQVLADQLLGRSARAGASALAGRGLSLHPVTTE